MDIEIVIGKQIAKDDFEQMMKFNNKELFENGRINSLSEPLVYLKENFNAPSRTGYIEITIYPNKEKVLKSFSSRLSIQKIVGEYAFSAQPDILSFLRNYLTNELQRLLLETLMTKKFEIV